MKLYRYAMAGLTIVGSMNVPAFAYRASITAAVFVSPESTPQGSNCPGGAPCPVDKKADKKNEKKKEAKKEKKEKKENKDEKAEKKE